MISDFVQRVALLFWQIEPNSIEVWVLDDDAFVNWRNHHHMTALYNSQKVTQSMIDLTLPHPGKYRVVFNNDFSALSKGGRSESDVEI